MIHVAVTGLPKALKLTSRGLAGLVRSVLRKEGVEEANISLAFVGDRQMAELNWKFLRHRGPTDVITFPLSDPCKTGFETCPAFNGEIVVSTETARKAARRFRHSVEEEVALYVIHGLLHLCGYDDRTREDRSEMREKEADYLQRAFRLRHKSTDNRKSKIYNRK